MQWNLIQSTGKEHTANHRAKIHWLEFYHKRYEELDRHTGAITYRYVPWCFLSWNSASSCLYSCAICLDLSVSVLDVFIQIRIQETSENISSLSFISKEKILQFEKLQSLQGEPCKCNEKSRAPQQQVSAFTGFKKNPKRLIFTANLWGLLCIAWFVLS